MHLIRDVRRRCIAGCTGALAATGRACAQRVARG